MEALKALLCSTPVKKARYIRNEMKTGLRKRSVISYIAQKQVKMGDVDGLIRFFDRISYHGTQETFFYEIDEAVWRYEYEIIVDNITVDYGPILASPLSELVWDEKLKKLFQDICGKIVKANNGNMFVEQCFSRIMEKPSATFKESLQRILFINQLLWQTKHKLVGIGRLDQLMYSYYRKEVDNGSLTRDEAMALVCDFMKALHKHYQYKSNALVGDTGQIIILGGLSEDGKSAVNELTYIIVEAMVKLQLPDPKVLLRVTDDTPDDLWKLSVKCIATGIGCPLLSNDNLVIPAMEELGYEKKDCYNYGTSACWEPLIIGDSFDQNNAGGFVLPDVINQLVEGADFESFEELLAKLDGAIEEEFLKINKKMAAMTYAEDPIQAVFINGCREKKSHSLKKDAKYAFYSILGTGFSNGINSLLAIKHLVYDEKAYTLSELNCLRKKGYSQDIIDRINEYPDFGCDDEEVIALTNCVLGFMQRANDIMINRYGYKCRFGLSSPSYMTRGSISDASFDGRKKNSPFNVHISSQKPIAYTELLNFASALNYSKGCVNGNVVDFIVTPNVILDNEDVFVHLIKTAFQNGVYQMQLNVLSSQQLIDAKSHPENYPNLIVRVWGFSAYFNDLPEQYQDLLIERALISEGKSVNGK